MTSQKNIYFLSFCSIPPWGCKKREIQE